MNKIIKDILKNKFKAGILIIILLGITGCGLSDKPEFELKTDSIDLEYGEVLDDFKTYIKTSDIDEDSLEYSCDTISESSVFPEVGKHVITYDYKGIIRKLEINVKDTTPPNITKLSDVNIIENSQFKYEDYIKIDELSKYDIDVDDNEVKYSVPGTYNANIKITDEYGNSSNITIPVVINELQLQAVVDSLNLEINQSNQINIKTNSNTPIQYTSSDNSIVSVDSSGNIKALKAGNATITACVNEKAVTCNVTVKDKSIPRSSHHNIPHHNNSSHDITYNVYVTKTGDCYHNSSCGYLSRSKIAISKSSALSQGYRACSRCNP